MKYIESKYLSEKNLLITRLGGEVNLEDVKVRRIESIKVVYDIS